MEDYKYKLSIIIPMYNAEKYIGICLDSILDSNLLKEEYEIVIVNDGSQDKSSEIAQDYASRYSNVTYLTQENQGQSTARNYGIKTCQGEYVWCVDADDKLISAQLPKLIDALDEYENLDILAVQLQNVTEEGKYLDIECTQPLVEHNRIISGVEAVISGYIPSSICALIVRRELFVENDIFFVKGITHQDVELTYRLMPHAKFVMFSNFIPYLYIYHPNSTSKSLVPEKKIKYIKDDIYIIKSFQKLALSYKQDNLLLYKVIYNQSQNVLFSLVYSLYKNKKTWCNMGINTAVVAELKKEKLYPIRGKFDSIKKTICARLFLNIPCVLE
ncbi:glycosyltransferase [Prevotella melaninogenica]|uniref:glycosyltransferase n=1 Tax=Prevotella melaninogenica TaxID=28132 RepID=UPI001C5D52E8|nr:glycosyltransferase [Prevotella melaninogenica]MBW4894955.1 glycosyltransferase [Prevotella melaninogenica]